MNKSEKSSVISEKIEKVPPVEESADINISPQISTPIYTPYETEDLDRAAFLYCQKGARLRATKRSEQRKNSNIIVFCFELPLSRAEIEELDISYANSECAVEPNLFVKKQALLRDLLHKKLKLPE